MITLAMATKNPNQAILDFVSKFPAPVFLTGSRAFNLEKENSDWDFMTAYSPETIKFLNDIDFDCIFNRKKPFVDIDLINSENNHYIDDYTCCAAYLGFLGIQQIHVILVEPDSLAIRLQVQKILYDQNILRDIRIKCQLIASFAETYDIHVQGEIRKYEKSLFNLAWKATYAALK